MPFGQAKPVCKPSGWRSKCLLES